MVDAWAWEMICLILMHNVKTLCFYAICDVILQARMRSSFMLDLLQRAVGV